MGDIVEAEAALTVATMVDIVAEVMTDTDAPLLHITGAMITDEDPDLDHFLHVDKTRTTTKLDISKWNILATFTTIEWIKTVTKNIKIMIIQLVLFQYKIEIYFA